MSRVAVTGASGYVGGVITRRLRRAGHDVLELGRRPSGECQGAYVSFHLGSPIVPDALRGAEILVHAAYDFSPRQREAVFAVNVEGSRALFRAADLAKVRRIVLISTLSAFPGCRSLYGKAKLLQEEDVLSRGGVVIRPGLVYGTSSAGMMGALDRMVVRLPFVPAIGGGRQRLFVCRDTDLAELVNEVAASPRSFPAPLVAAAPEPMTLRAIVEFLAASRGRRVRWVPVPYGATHVGLRLLEALGARLRVSSDSLVSLAHPDPRPDFTATREVGVDFAPLAPRAGA